MSESKEEKIFPDGLIFKEKRAGAPDFVRGGLSVKVPEFKAFLDKHNNNGWVNFDMLTSKAGKMYIALNDWKPESKEEVPQFTPEEIAKLKELRGETKVENGEISPDDIPF